MYVVVGVHVSYRPETGVGERGKPKIMYDVRRSYVRRRRIDRVDSYAEDDLFGSREEAEAECARRTAQEVARQLTQ